MAFPGLFVNFVLPAFLFRNPIQGGYIAFGAAAAYGWYLFLKGVRGETRDWLGHEKAPRWLYIAAGLFLQLPLLGYAVFVHRMRDSANRII